MASYRPQIGVRFLCLHRHRTQIHSFAFIGIVRSHPQPWHGIVLLGPNPVAYTSHCFAFTTTVYGNQLQNYRNLRNTETPQTQTRTRNRHGDNNRLTEAHEAHGCTVTYICGRWYWDWSDLMALIKTGILGYGYIQTNTERPTKLGTHRRMEGKLGI
jgi:hypothetical protein